MKVLITNLSLRGFKGGELSLEFGPSENFIFGANGAGKTRLYDAWLWLLFGKDSQNRADFKILPIDGSKQQAEVEASLEIDGKEYSFKRVFLEKWTRKKGDVSPTFTGYQTKYFINDVPKKQAEYNEAVRNIVDENLFKILTNPTFFNENLSWQERRRVLLDLAGETDVLKQDKYKPLEEELSSMDVAELKKKWKSQQRKINEEFKAIPARIDELQAQLENLTKREKEEIEAEIEKIKQEIILKKQASRKEEIYKRIEELSERIREKEFLKQKQKEDFLKGTSSLDELYFKDNEIALRIKQIEEELGDLRAEWKKIYMIEFEENALCPVCKQPLPVDMLKRKREEFNKWKACQLEEINKEGKAKAKRLEELKQKRLELSADIQRRLKAEQKVKKIEEADIPEKDEKERLIAELKNVKDDESLILLEKKLDSLQEELAEAKVKEHIFKSISELRKRESFLADKYAELEDKLTLLEEFIVEQISAVEESVNSKFSFVSFRLFNKLINGGIEETCECEVDGVPYRNLNGAKKINAGLDIIRTLQKHFGLSIPVWIDNRESVSEIIKLDSQVINLVVSKEDKTLRLERR